MGAVAQVIFKGIASMSANFDKCFSFIVGEEGKYVDDPRDNGGATNFGITLKTLTEWRKPRSVTAADVRNLTIEEARAIYEANYWRPIQGDSFPHAAALLLLDAAINSGPKQAIMWLQKSLNVPADGHCGALTLAAWRACERSSVRPPEQVLADFCAYRMLLMTNHEDFKTYGKGWLSRVAKMCLRAGKLS